MSTRGPAFHCLLIYEAINVRTEGGGRFKVSVLGGSHGSWFKIRGIVGVVGGVAGYISATGGVEPVHPRLRVPCVVCCFELFSEVVRAGERVFIYVGAFGSPV